MIVMFNRKSMKMANHKFKYKLYSPSLSPRPSHLNALDCNHINLAFATQLATRERIRWIYERRIHSIEAAHTRPSSRVRLAARLLLIQPTLSVIHRINWVMPLDKSYHRRVVACECKRMHSSAKTRCKNRVQNCDEVMKRLNLIQTDMWIVVAPHLPGNGMWFSIIE